jgi:hypothetical protein
MTQPEIINNRSFIFRGAVIHETSVFESILDIYLANYFCKSQETVNEFVSLILGSNRLSLDGKRKIMESVIKRRKQKNYDGFKTDLNTMLRERNNFAHCTLAFGKEALDKSGTHIGLIKINADSRIEWYDQPKVTGIIMTIRKCTNAIQNLLDE